MRNAPMEPLITHSALTCGKVNRATKDDSQEAIPNTKRFLTTA